MRRFAAIIILIGIFLTGCASEKDTLSPAIEFRAAAARAGCSFHAAVQADLGETAVQFAMDCDAGPDGAVALTVTEPETLSGSAVFFRFFMSYPQNPVYLALHEIVKPRTELLFSLFAVAPLPVEHFLRHRRDIHALPAPSLRELARRRRD